MKNKITLITALIVLIAVNKVKAQDNQVIIFQGITDTKYNGEFVHIYNHLLNEQHDSAMVVNGTFTFKRTFKEPTRYMFFSSYELKVKHGYSPFGILVDHASVIQFKADMASLVNSKIIGSDAQGRLRPLHRANGTGAKKYDG